MERSPVRALRKGSFIILFVILMAGVISNTLLTEVATWENRDLSVLPGSQVTTPGGLVTYEIHVQGTTDPIEGEYVTLSATTTHSGITYTIAPNNRAAPFTCTMTVDVSASTPPGTYSITVIATSTWDQTHTRSETVQLTVMELITATVIQPSPEETTAEPPPPHSEETTAEPPPPHSEETTKEPEEVPPPTITPFDFVVKLRPSTIETSKGEPAHYQVIIEYSDPIWNEVPINLQAEMPFEWMQYDLSPTHKITITSSSDAKPGTYVFNVVGTAQGLERVKEGSLTIVGVAKESQEQAPSRDSTSEEDLLLEVMKEQFRANVKDEKVLGELIDNLDKLKSLRQDAEQEQAEEKKKAQQDAALLQMILAVISFVVGLVAGAIGSFLKGKGRTQSKKSKREDGYCPECGKPLEP